MKIQDFNERLKDSILIADGAMGSMLHEAEDRRAHETEALTSSTGNPACAECQRMEKRWI